MKKIIWQNLLKQAKTSVDFQAHPHLSILEMFLEQADIYARHNESNLSFEEFEQFILNKTVAKSVLFEGPLAKIFRTLDEQQSEQTLAFAANDHTIIYHFKDKSCTDIYNIEIDLDSYTYASTLEENNHGSTRLYKNLDRHEIVVKTPNPEMPYSGYSQGRKREAEVAQLLYPNDGLYCVNEHQHSMLNKSGEIIPAYGIYVITPNIPSLDLTEFCKNIRSKSQLVNVLLAITLELHRIHAAGIIHGNILPENIRIWRDPQTQKIGVRFVDFQSSYYLYSEPASKSNNINLLNWAPERIDVVTNVFTDESFDFPSLDSHPKQDIYSFGYTLKKALSHHPLLLELPFIAKFYTECELPETKRPLAERFIYELKRQSELENAVNRSSSTAALITLGIAGKDRHIQETYFIAKEEEKNQEEPVTLNNQNYSILDRKKSASSHLLPTKPNSLYMLPQLIHLGVKASKIIRRLGGYSK